MRLCAVIEATSMAVHRTGGTDTVLSPTAIQPMYTGIPRGSLITTECCAYVAR